MLTVFIHIFYYLFKISAFVMHVEIGHLAYLKTLDFLNQKRCNIAIAHKAKPKSFDAVVNVHAANFSADMSFRIQITPRLVEVFERPCRLSN